MVLLYRRQVHSFQGHAGRERATRSRRAGFECPSGERQGPGARETLQRMLRIHFLQHWFNLSDPAVEEALYESISMRDFVGIDLGHEPGPDETTVLNFRHLLERHDLGRRIFEQVGTVLGTLSAKMAAQIGCHHPDCIDGGAQLRFRAGALIAPVPDIQRLIDVDAKRLFRRSRPRLRRTGNQRPGALIPCQSIQCREAGGRRSLVIGRANSFAGTFNNRSAPRQVFGQRTIDSELGRRIRKLLNSRRFPCFLVGDLGERRRRFRWHLRSLGGEQT